jgi:hypothetical protein
MNSTHLIRWDYLFAKHFSFKKYLLLLTLPFMLYSGQLAASNKYSIGNGNWVGSAIWSHTLGGPSCGCTPAGTDSVFITHNITLNKNLTGGSGISALLKIYSGGTINGGSTYDLDVKASGKLDVSGTLIIKNLTFFNGSTVFINASANVTVNGTLENKNNSNSVFINGPVTVLGPLIAGNGSVISGTGPIIVSTGPISNTGNIFGCGGNPPPAFPISLPGPCAIPLPVELINFSADVSKPNEIILSWATASEVNSSFFTLEKSSDAKRFNKVADIAASGNTSTISNYKFIDKVVEKAQGYYRLSQTDLNGNVQVFKIINVQSKTLECIQIKTENNSGMIKVNFSCNQYSTAIVSVNDFVGKCISRQVINPGSSPDFNYSFNILNSGMYIVTIFYDNSIIKRQVCKF